MRTRDEAIRFLEAHEDAWKAAIYEAQFPWSELDEKQRFLIRLDEEVFAIAVLKNGRGDEAAMKYWRNHHSWIVAEHKKVFREKTKYPKRPGPKKGPTATSLVITAKVLGLLEDKVTLKQALGRVADEMGKSDGATRKSYEEHNERFALTSKPLTKKKK